MPYFVILPAAGRGERLGAGRPKALVEFQGSSGCGGSTIDVGTSSSGGAKACTILDRTLRVFLSDPHCLRIVISLPVEWVTSVEDELAQYAMVRVIAGGASRQDSVRLAAETLAGEFGDESEIPVLVHDAARCCLGTDVVQRVLDGVRVHGAATAGVRVYDAMVKANGSFIEDTVPRDDVWLVQTPQGFLLKDLVLAHREGALSGTCALDDASLVRAIRPVALVNGDKLNVKVTDMDDLRFAFEVAKRGLR